MSTYGHRKQELGRYLNMLVLEGWIAPNLPFIEHETHRWGFLRLRIEGKSAVFPIILPRYLPGVNALDAWDRVRLTGPMVYRKTNRQAPTRERLTLLAEAVELVSQHKAPETYRPYHGKRPLTPPEPPTLAPPVGDQSPEAPAPTSAEPTRKRRRSPTRKAITQATPGPVSPRVLEQLAAKAQRQAMASAGKATT